MGSRKQLRILLFLHVLDGRSVAEVVKATALEFQRRGHEVMVATTNTTLPEPDLAGIPVIDLGGGGKRTIWTLPALIALLKSELPDVVIAHSNGPGRAAILASRLVHTRPLTLTVEHVDHSTIPWGRPKLLRRWANRQLLPRADRVIAVSPGVAASLVNRYPRTAENVTIIPPPLNRWEVLDELALQSPGDEWFAPPAQVITTIGNVNESKDHATLIRAFSRIRKCADHPLTRLGIIGRPDNPQLLRKLKALIDELELTEDVRFLGYQANPIKYLARSALFVLSSRSEGAPIAILEAMALGIPVVSTEVPGPAWLLEDGKVGLLTPTGDDRALAEAIDTILRERRLSSALIKAGKDRVARFTPANIADEYLRLIRSLTP